MVHSKGSLTNEIALFAASNCTSLPFASVTTYSCPTATNQLWTLLDTKIATNSLTAWTLVTLNFTPTQNYKAIVLGPSCSSLLGSNYYFIGNLILNKTKYFMTPKVRITDSGHYCQGNLVLKANFDSIPLSFQWYKDSLALVGSIGPTYSVPNGGLGLYQVQLQYDSGCVITKVFVVDTTLITFDLDSIRTCTIGAATGEVLVSNIQNGTKSYEFSLNSAPFVIDSSFSQLTPGVYLVTVRDTNLCEAYQNITVESFPMPISNFEVDSVCLGLASIFNDKSTIVSGGITHWEWGTPGNPTTQNTSYVFSTHGTLPITHTVVSDSGCIDDTTINVIVHPLPVADFVYSPIQIYTFSLEVCFSNLSTGAISYVWNFDFSGPSGSSTLTSPCTIKFPSDEEKTYRVKLIAISDQGCLDSTELNITVLDDFILYVPNAFTPNDDNNNDEFTIVIAGIETYYILIFNNWGEVIFTSSDPAEAWDGKAKGVLVPIGTYVYKIRVKSANREVREVIGHVNVLR